MNQERLERNFAEHLHNAHAFRGGRKRTVRRRRRNRECRDLPERTAQIIIHGILEVRMVEDVEEIGSERELHPFGQRKGLLQIQVSVEVSRPADSMPALALKSAGDAKSLAAKQVVFAQFEPKVLA